MMKSTNTMGAEALCKYVEEGVKTIIHEKDVKCIPWIEFVSDHTPRFCDDILGVFPVMTQNVLSMHFLHHLKEEIVDGVDVSQRLSHCEFAKADFTNERHELIIDHVMHMLEAGTIVCLQEVSPELLKMMTDQTSPLWSRIRFTISDRKASGKRLLLTLWDSQKFLHEGSFDIVAPDCDLEGDKLTYVSLQDKESEKRIKIVNVHIAYGKNAQYSKLLLAVFNGGHVPTVVCGDFNASARYPPRGMGDHIMTHYADPRFQFVPPTGQRYSHVNKFGNTRDSRDQLDLFDHIIIMNAETK